MHVIHSQPPAVYNPIYTVSDRPSTVQMLGKIDKIGGEIRFTKSHHFNINKTRTRVEQMVTDMEELCKEPEIKEFDGLVEDCHAKYKRLVEKGDLLLNMMLPYEYAARQRAVDIANGKIKTKREIKKEIKKNIPQNKFQGDMEVILSPQSEKKWLQMARNLSDSELANIMKNMITLNNDMSNNELKSIKDEFESHSRKNGSSLIMLALEKLIDKTQADNKDYRDLSPLNKQKVIEAILESLSETMINPQSFILTLNRTKYLNEKHFPCIFEIKTDGKSEYLLATLTAQILASIDMEFRNGILHRSLREKRQVDIFSFDKFQLKLKFRDLATLRPREKRSLMSILEDVGKFLVEGFRAVKTLLFDGALLIYKATRYGLAHLGHIVGLVSTDTVLLLQASMRRQVANFAPFLSFVRSSIRPAVLGTALLIAYPLFKPSDNHKDQIIKAYEEEKARRDKAEVELYDSLQRTLKLSIADRNKIEGRHESREAFLLQTARISDTFSGYSDYIIVRMRELDEIARYDPMEEVKEQAKLKIGYRLPDAPRELLIKQRRAYEGKGTIEIAYHAPLAYNETYYKYALMMVPLNTEPKQIVFQNKQSLQYIVMRHDNETRYAINNEKYYFQQYRHPTECEMSVLRYDNELNQECKKSALKWSNDVQYEDDRFHLFHNPERKRINVICDNVQLVTTERLIYSHICETFDVMVG